MSGWHITLVQDCSRDLTLCATDSGLDALMTDVQPDETGSLSAYRQFKTEILVLIRLINSR